jgi:hypothetical protein
VFERNRVDGAAPPDAAPAPPEAVPAVAAGMPAADAPVSRMYAWTVFFLACALRRRGIAGDGARRRSPFDKRGDLR